MHCIQYSAGHIVIHHSSTIYYLLSLLLSMTGEIRYWHRYHRKRNAKTSSTVAVPRCSIVFTSTTSFLVDFNLSVYFTNERVRCKESYCPSQDPESEDDDERVAEVQYCGYDCSDT